MKKNKPKKPCKQSEKKGKEQKKPNTTKCAVNANHNKKRLHQSALRLVLRNALARPVLGVLAGRLRILEGLAVGGPRLEASVHLAPREAALIDGVLLLLGGLGEALAVSQLRVLQVHRQDFAGLLELGRVLGHVVERGRHTNR